MGCEVLEAMAEAEDNENPAAKREIECDKSIFPRTPCGPCPEAIEYLDQYLTNNGLKPKGPLVTTRSGFWNSSISVTVANGLNINTVTIEGGKLTRTTKIIY